jgi:hypothetical protein
MDTSNDEVNSIQRNPRQLAVNSTREQPISEIPEEVMRAIDEQIADAGGPLEEPEIYKGSVARTMFDTPASNDGTVTVLFPRHRFELLPRQSLVRIKSTDGRFYLGIATSGPFAEPDGLRADSPMMVSVAISGALLTPKFHGRAQVELIGEEIDGSIVPPRRRPMPNSPAVVLSGPEAAEVLKLDGSIRIGIADSHEDVEVRVPLKKSVQPRHAGVIGTTGAGKSTTVSGQVDQLQQAGAAIVILDTEGEYTAINEPTSDSNMEKALARRGLNPRGVANTHLYYLVGRDTRNPAHPDKLAFSLPFSDLSPHAVMEILDLTPAQQERFLKAYDITKTVMEKLKIFPVTADDKQKLLEIDELQEGYPKMTLSLLLDVVKWLTAQVGKDEQEPYLETPGLLKNTDILKQCKSNIPGDPRSWYVVLGRLNRIKRLGVFDIAKVQIKVDEMLQQGRVSIIDLSDTDSPHVNNLVIAQLLRKIQEQQEVNYAKATAAGKAPTPTMIFIEEAHEFLSAQRIAQMPVLFQQVARIARRGRKRWLGLTFITQLPQHLPDEVLGLVNNWLLHKISDSQVVGRLRKSIGGIDDSLWSRLPSLAPGQAIASFTSMTRALQVAVDPTPCKLLLVD